MGTLPAGPRFALIQSVEVMTDPFRYYRKLFARFPDPVLLPTMNGTIVMTAHPDGIREIFSARPDTFSPFGVNAVTPLLGEKSVIVIKGSEHQSRRKLMAPPFHGERMHRFGRIFRDAARAQIARTPEGRPFVMQEVTAAITLEAIVKAVFGITDPVEVDRWSRALTGLMNDVSPLGVFLTFLRSPLFPPWRRFLAARDTVDRMIFDEIARRRRSDAVGEDILSMLLQARFDDGAGMDDVEIRDQLITLLGAGHETTATALAWAFYWLDRNPHVKARLLDELEALGPDPDPMKVAGLPYLEAVCLETLRMNPILPDVLRKVEKPFTLRGYEVPVGMHVAVCVAAAHENPAVFPDPLTFKPERFVGRMYGPFEFMPFGGGARRCMGAAFALYEMKTVVATLLLENTLRLAKDGPIEPARRNLTMGPRGGVEMVRTARPVQKPRVEAVAQAAAAG